MAITFPTDTQNEARLSRLDNTGQIQSGNVPDMASALNTQVGTNTPTTFSNITNLLSQNLTQEANRSFFSNDSLASAIQNTKLTYQPVIAQTLRPEDYPNLSPSQLASIQQQINLGVQKTNQQQAQLIQQADTLRQQRVQDNLDTLATTQKIFSVLGGIDPLRSGRNIAGLTGNQSKVKQDLAELFNQATNKQIELNLAGEQINIAGLKTALDTQQQQEQLDFQQSMALSDRLGTFVDDKGNLQQIAGQTNVPTLQGREANRQDQELLMRRQQQIAELFGFVPNLNGEVQYLRPDGLPTTNPAQAQTNEFGMPQLFSSENELLRRQQAKQELALNDIKLQYAPAQQELALQQAIAGQDLTRIQIEDAKEKLRQIKSQGNQQVTNAQALSDINKNLGNNPVSGKPITNPVYAKIDYQTDKQGNIIGIKKVDMAENWRDTLLRNGLSVGDLENDNALIRKFGGGGTEASPVLENISKFVSSTDGQEALRRITFTGTATTEKGVKDYPTDFIAIQTDTGGYRMFAIPRDLVYGDSQVKDIIKTSKNDKDLMVILDEIAKKTEATELKAKDFIIKYGETKDAGIETKENILQMVIGGVAGQDLLELQKDIPTIYNELNDIFKKPTQVLDTKKANEIFKDYQENRIKQDFPDYTEEELLGYKQDLNSIISVFNNYKDELKSSYGSARETEAKDWYVATIGSLIGGIQNPNFILAETLWNSNIPAKYTKPN